MERWSLGSINEAWNEEYTGLSREVPSLALLLKYFLLSSAVVRFEWRPKIHLNSWQALLNYLYMCSLSNGSFLHISWKLSCSWHCHVIARWSCVQIQSEAFLCGASFSLWVFFGYSSFNPCHISVSCSGCTLPLTPRQSWQTSVPTTFNWMSVTKSIDVSVIRIVYLKSITRNLKKYKFIINTIIITAT